MKKTLKGAVAASAAAALLLGGAGSLAFWSSTTSAPGGTFTSGVLTLTTDAADPGCGSWMLDAAGGGGTFDPATDLLVPGDTVTEDCTFLLTATGNHMQGTINATDASATGALIDSGDVTVSSTFMVNGATATTFQSAANPNPPGAAAVIPAAGTPVEVDVTVTFAAAADNSTQDEQAVLDDIAVTANQNHP